MSALRLALLAFVLAAACRRSPDPASPRVSAPAAPAPAPATTLAAPAPDASTTVAPPDDELIGEAPESNPKSETVKIKLVADPARKARVSWGRKDLGFAPLEIERPRGSGPLDLVVVAPGALTLHTRVYTDRDDKLALRLYAEGEAPSMLGYRPPTETPPKNPSSGSAVKPKRR